MTDGLPDPATFGAAFTDFVEAMQAAARRPDSPLLVRVREHLGADPNEVASTDAELPITEHPNLQLALDAVLADAEVIGYSSNQNLHMAGGDLRMLMSGHRIFGEVAITPASRTDVAVGDGRVVRCVSSGIYLAEYQGARLALHVSRMSEHRPPFGGNTLRLEALCADTEAVSALLRDLRVAMREHNVYRGRVISLHQVEQRSIAVEFHRIEPIPRDALILPDGALERLERHAIGITTGANALREAGRSLKRGVLLHGPPGTGKTRSVNYLLGAMPGRTTVILTGRGLGLIEQAVAIARELAPATVVFEDVDLVATERTMPFTHGGGGVLFELLNQMEGLAEDADLLFLLTTNRADIIEPALAARPGRIDLALEIPLPDAAARTRLLALYGEGIELDERALEELTGRTETLSGAFIKELMRQASLRAALESRPPDAADVSHALDDMLEERSALTRRLLGQPSEDGGIAGPDAAAMPQPFPNMARAMGAAGILHISG